MIRLPIDLSQLYFHFRDGVGVYVLVDNMSDRLRDHETIPILLES